MQARTRVPASIASAELRANWRLLLGAFLGVSAGVSALPYYTQGLFVPALSGEFGWTREQISLVTLAGGIVLALSSPFVGALIDRVGVRRPLTWSFAALSIGYLVLAAISGEFALFLLLQVAIFAMGAATGPVSFTRMVNQRFDAMRGFALGCTLAGAGAMAVLAPPVVAAIIEAHGWRVGYHAIAAIVAVTGVLSLGLLWSASARTGAGSVSTSSAIGVAAGAALRTALFWRLLLTFGLLALGIGGFTFHLVPLLTDAGLSLTAAASTQSLIGLSVLVGRLASGFLMDRFFAPAVSAFIMLLAALGVAGLALFGAVAAAPCALLIGFALGTEGDVIGYLAARYFGMQAYGRLYGLLYGLFALGLGLSPVIISRIQQSAGSYEPALWTSFAALTVGALSMLLLPRFRSAA